MLFIYEFANGNANAALREYGLHFPNRRQPDRKYLDMCSEDGTFSYGVFLIFFKRLVRTSEQVLVELSIHHSTVHRVLKTNRLHPYHFKKMQDLSVEDAEVRLIFCWCYLNKLGKWKGVIEH